MIRHAVVGGMVHHRAYRRARVEAGFLFLLGWFACALSPVLTLKVTDHMRAMALMDSILRNRPALPVFALLRGRLKKQEHRHQ